MAMKHAQKAARVEDAIPHGQVHVQGYDPTYCFIIILSLPKSWCRRVATLWILQGYY